MSPSLHTLSDEQLVKKSLEEKEAFGFLMERYEKPLIRYLMRISDIDRETAEDLMQEVFIKTWKNLNDFDESLKFSSWIYRIAHNEAISFFRKRNSEPKKVEIVQENDEEGEQLLALLPSKIDLPKELDQKFTTEIVQKILLMLPERDRSILWFRFIEEKSYDEISDILRIPMGTVATLLSRAKKSFLKTLTRHNISLSPSV
jgi:RNA polymerase sigma-70 factor, ECF subfamily